MYPYLKNLNKNVKVVKHVAQVFVGPLKSEGFGGFV